MNNFKQNNVNYILFTDRGEYVYRFSYPKNTDLSISITCWCSYYSHKAKDQVDKIDEVLYKEIDYNELPEDIQMMLNFYRNGSCVDIMWNLKKLLSTYKWKKLLKIQKKGIKND